MHLEWILNPAALYGAVPVGLALCLTLFVSLKRDLQRAESRSTKKLAALEGEWRGKLDVLDEGLKELAQVSNMLVPPTPPRSGLNLNRRSQALQLFRRGEAPQEIAAALSIPIGEVELLIKVQQIAAAGVDRGF